MRRGHTERGKHVQQVAQYCCMAGFDRMFDCNTCRQHAACPPASLYTSAGYGNWYDAPLPLVQGGNATYFGASVPFDLGTLTAIEFAAMAGVESFRGAAEPEKRIYPGGPFDPAGMVCGWAALETHLQLPRSACSH
jgi:hypothetical protein